jgi:hypothetical protein
VKEVAAEHGGANFPASPEEGKKLRHDATGPTLFGVTPRLEGLGDRCLCPNRAPRQMYYRG